MAQVQAKVIFEFWAENDAELSLALGDVVTVLNQDDAGWWEGELNDKKGLFPSNYVELLQKKPTPPPPRPPAKRAVPSKAAPTTAAPTRTGVGVTSPRALASPKAPVVHSVPPIPRAAGTFVAAAAVPPSPSSVASPHSVASPRSLASPSSTRHLIDAVSPSSTASPRANAPRSTPAAPRTAGAVLEKKAPNGDTGMKPAPGAAANGKVKASRTKFGLWASNQAKIAAVMAVMMGGGSMLWGFIAEGHWHWDLHNKQYYRFLAGCYCMAVGALTWIFEKTCGARRRQFRFPLRGLVYLLLCVPMFWADATMTVGGFYAAVGFTNFMATCWNEWYDAPPKVAPVKKQEQSNTTTLGSIIQRVMILKEQNKIGVICFMFFYICANVALFTHTVITWNGLIAKMAKPPSGWGPYAKAFGKLLDLNCSLILLPVCRTMIRSIYNASTKDQSCGAVFLRNLFAFMPLDRNLAFHKLVAKVVLVTAIGHTIAHFINYAFAPDVTIELFAVWPWISGGIICVAMLLIYSAAYDNTKRGQFEIFWYSHHFFVVFYVFILLHGHAYYNAGFWPYFVGPGLFYIAERILRFRRARQPVVVGSVTMMKPCVFSIEFIKEGSIWEHTDYKEGQYLFLQAPDISPIQWHPFTISSAPQERTVTVHIRVSDEHSWTYQLMKNLAAMGPNMTYFKLDRMGSNGQRIPGKIVDDVTGRPLLRIDGPHSAPTQHIGEYSTVMIVGAGIGVTPVAATMKSVIFHRWKYAIGQAFPDNAYFYWVCGYGDIDAFRWFIKVIKDAQDEVVHMRATQQKSMATKNFEVHIWITSTPKDPKPVEFVVDDEIGFWGVPREDDKVDKYRANFTEEDIYRAMKCPTKHTQLEDVHIYSGRPEWAPRFESVAKSHPTGDVGVCYCGNPMIAKDLAKACHTVSHDRTDGLFILHKENF